MRSITYCSYWKEKNGEGGRGERDADKTNKKDKKRRWRGEKRVTPGVGVRLVRGQSSDGEGGEGYCQMQRQEMVC